MKIGLPAATSVLLLAAAIGAACGGDGKTTPPPSPTADGGGGTAAPTASIDVPAGLPSIVTAAVLSGDPIELARLTFYQQVACSQQPKGDVPPPTCRPNESDGTRVDTFPFSACEHDWVRPEQVPDVYRDVLGSGKVRILAAYKPKPLFRLFGGGFTADTVIVVTTQAAGKATDAAAVHIRDGKVAWLERSCGNPAELVANDRVDSFIISPQDLAMDRLQPAAGGAL